MYFCDLAFFCIIYINQKTLHSSSQTWKQHIYVCNLLQCLKPERRNTDTDTDTESALRTELVAVTDIHCKSIGSNADKSTMTVSTWWWRNWQRSRHNLGAVKVESNNNLQVCVGVGESVSSDFHNPQSQDHTTSMFRSDDRWIILWGLTATDWLISFASRPC